MAASARTVAEGFSIGIRSNGTLNQCSLCPQMTFACVGLTVHSTHMTVSSSDALTCISSPSGYFKDQMSCAPYFFTTRAPYPSLKDTRHVRTLALWVTS